jgi:MYXO-CTERM domain-containing protein
MFAHRIATGLTLALLALPATAAAQYDDGSGGGEADAQTGPPQRSLAAPARSLPTDDDPDWPELTFAGVAVLALAGGAARVRLRRMTA